MAGFTAPLDPAGWTFTTPGALTVPPDLRYARLRLPQLRATRSSPATVRMPAPGLLRTETDPSGSIFVEVQVNPFGLRHAVQALLFGVPTFYFVFDAGSPLVAFADGDAADEGEPLATVAGVSLLCAGQDRLARDPALWSSLILAGDRAAGPRRVAVLRRCGRGADGRRGASGARARPSRCAARDRRGPDRLRAGQPHRPADRGGRRRSPALRRADARGQPGHDAARECVRGGRLRHAPPVTRDGRRPDRPSRGREPGPARDPGHAGPATRHVH